MAFRLSTVCFTICWLTSTSVAWSESPTFEKSIQPLLARRCGKCHRADVRKASLDLSSLAGLHRGGESGEPLLAKPWRDGLLWLMVESGDMPPDGEPALEAAELALLRRWLESGAHSQSPQADSADSLNQHDVLPIVLLRCTTCHGPRIRRGGLDLRTRSSMLRGGESGPALTPGSPGDSLMIQRIESNACPPSELLLKFFVRRPTKNEVKTLRDWIRLGAPEENVAADVATSEPDPLVTDEDRRHWAFQPVKISPGQHSIDEFIEAKLRTEGLTLAPSADRDALIRRAHLDLLGLPPSLEAWKKWRDHDSPTWYREMIDQLLESPRYGERWGRYWLDLAGYADSEGGVSADPIRKVAWKYRDYVIRSFNADTPYDQFLVEQLAGDELIDRAGSDEATPQLVENLVATGFLRLGIDQTGSRTMNFVPERLGVINDALTIVSEGLMGLTVACARCHSHKYDAIPQRDYYRLKAVFQGALDEHDWLTFKNRSLNVDVPARRRRVAERNPPLEAKIRRLESRRRAAEQTVRLELLRSHYPGQSDADRQETLRALKIADNNRTQPQRILVEMLQQVELLPDAEQPNSVHQARRVVADLAREIANVQRQLEPPLAIRALWDRGDPSPTYVLRRGEHTKPGRLVGPGVPSVLTDGKTPFVSASPFPKGTPTTGRRLAFARWLTSPQHPLTARVMVNRVWHYHFGTGLVKSLENFGVQGERPSHPELLDWLAGQFTSRGWSVKELHRLMMSSRTYRQSSRVTEKRYRKDPQNRLLSRMPLRRMDAEALRDSLLFVSGRLDSTVGGPPDSVTVDRNGQVTADPLPSGQWRRSVYLLHRRTSIPTMLDTFDYPEMGPNCLVRNVSTVAPQSLLLMNNKRVRELAGSLAKRVDRATSETVKDRLAAQVELVYALALTRKPSKEEQRLGVQALVKLGDAWQADVSRPDESSRANRSLDSDEARPDPKGDLALETFCHAILNSAAFVYID